MKIEIDLADNFIDVWNEKKEKWERYVKVELEEEKELPEKLNVEKDGNGRIDDIYMSRQEIDERNKINEIIEFLKKRR